jgi:hypothetical protein
MISVAATTGDAKPVAAKAAAICKNLKTGLTTSLFRSARVETPFSYHAPPQTAPAASRIGKGRPQRSIDDVCGTVRMAISPRLLLNCIEPFFPAIDLIIRG